jgi:putative phage-type endonuclease
MIILAFLKKWFSENNYTLHSLDELSEKTKLPPEIIKDIAKKYNLLKFTTNVPLNNYTDNTEKYKPIVTRLKYLDSLPKPKQKSKEWHAIRKSLISATAGAAVLNQDGFKKPFEILLDKCEKGKPFNGNIHTYRGNKYENAMCMVHSFLNDVKTNEYSVIRHQKYPHIGASPDGICSKYCLSSDLFNKKVGTMVEIKCPMKIKNDVPHHYWCQVQLQLEVCDLEKCDFIQGEITEYENWKQFYDDSDEDRFWISKEFNNFKGCVIQVMTQQQKLEKDGYISSKHIYPPKLDMDDMEYLSWIFENRNKVYNIDDEDYYFDKVIYWKMEKYKLIEVLRDRVWFNKSIGIFTQFWDYVLFYRDNPQLLDEVIEYSPNKKQHAIFNLIHRQYTSKNVDSKWNSPLYTDEIEVNENIKIINKNLFVKK